MATKGDFKFDKIGYWSELKLEIIRKYAAAYSSILSSRRNPAFHHIYIDGFAGAGIHQSKTRNELIEGSPLIALSIDPPFREYHFIDLDPEKVEMLDTLVGDREDARIYHGDCNKVLLEKVFPRARFEEYRRGLCILDPYGLDLEWKVIATAGHMKSIEIFLNFPVADINRNVLWHDPKRVTAEQRERLNAFWGDDTWRDIAYRPAAQGQLFGAPPDEKVANDDVAAAFRRRLEEVASFRYVPEPIAMRNSKNAVVYYLFFASQQPVAEKIVMDIFNDYRDRQGG